ncbi:uncharacterized protein [Montipora capricornis]|uniref:uncharacterized protein n=1 Tax=Montipora capricornis TaxID=246305 RepID=UPI0035F2005F
MTRAFLERVVSGPPIRNPDPEILSQLARDMETCLLGSTQLGNASNLNSMDTLGKIVARLPIHFRAKWAERASQLYEAQTTPTFAHLTEIQIIDPLPATKPVSGTQCKEGQQLCLDVVATRKGVRLEKVWTTETLTVTERSIPTSKDVKQWPLLKNIGITDLVDKKPAIERCIMDGGAKTKSYKQYLEIEIARRRNGRVDRPGLDDDNPTSLKHGNEAF